VGVKAQQNFFSLGSRIEKEGKSHQSKLESPFKGEQRGSFYLKQIYTRIAEVRYLSKEGVRNIHKKIISWVRRKKSPAGSPSK
jgi:selenocysteine lyase/cysteine desulfurase